MQDGHLRARQGMQRKRSNKQLSLGYGKVAELKLIKHDEAFFILTIIYFDENYFLETSTPTARPGPAFQPACKWPSQPRQQKKAVGASMSLFPSSHTQWNLVILPTVPRIATFNSRSQFRAMLDCLARKKKPKTWFLVSNYRVLLASLSFFVIDSLVFAFYFAAGAEFFFYFYFYSSTARFAGRFFTRMLQ